MSYKKNTVFSPPPSYNIVCCWAALLSFCSFKKHSFSDDVAGKKWLSDLQIKTKLNLFFFFKPLKNKLKNCEQQNFYVYIYVICSAALPLSHSSFFFLPSFLLFSSPPHSLWLFHPSRKKKSSITDNVISLTATKRAKKKKWNKREKE